ncbi:hypothetical protein QM467_10900 [Rhodoblastus sp. 17X3]|uniref:hypothetical protein n=1 Tax=Rhodoblastus sp. 17X3 TaxID=3047026 RepID=UPI0024B8718A|nr:hypothetical protein [Rhodoblastus sp. 17X3]MDI9848564.1 hypothetical protein [Rhodoblastus sp. 17X3]
MDSSWGYVILAEDEHGPIPRPVGSDYIGGAAMGEWDRAQPHACNVNLKTSITCSDDYLPKGVNCRTGPRTLLV